MLEQFGVSIHEIPPEDFLEVAVLNRSTKGAKISSFRRAPCSKIKNEMLQQFGVNPNEIYQKGFLKVAALNHSTKGATL